MNDAAAPSRFHSRRVRAEREADRIFEMSPALLAVAGFDGYLRRFNPAFEVFGYSREELLSRPWIEFAHASDRERTLQAAALLERGADVVELENRVICRDGSLRWVQWSTRVVPEEGFVCAAGRDVTESRRAAEERAALRRVATLVTRAPAPTEMFDAVAAEVGQLLPAEDTAMLRYEDDETAIVVATWGKRAHDLTVGTRLTLEGHNVTGIVYRTGRPARIDNYATATGVIGTHLREVGTRSAVGCPIVVEGRLWGAMVAAQGVAEPLPEGTEPRMSAFTELVATAMSNIEARSELAASRARIVAATDDERRRVVRDLHDGAQQRLVHTVVTLKLARRALEQGDEAAPTLLADALDHAEQANVELRELAHGILPAVLIRGGLHAGVEALASRMPVPIDVGVCVGRLPAAAEATAYFVVAEALTNIAKHARARRAEVTARVQDGTLRVRVRDDGVGGAQPAGSGLVGLGDRVAALDGRLRVESPSGGGTLVAADIPCPAAEEPRTPRAR
jgi:PAS domain S-box-containing protein